MESDDNKILNDGLKQYYKLKGEYENNNSKIKHKIRNNKNLSFKEKRTELKKLVPKCINCKRPGGTIFSNLYSAEQDGRRLVAVCGIRDDPCPLNITIDLGIPQLKTDEIDEYERNILISKNKIIADKNNLIFGYITSQQAIENFESLKEELSMDLSLQEITLANYLADTRSNKDSLLQIKNAHVVIYDIIANIQKLIEQYKKTDNTQFVRDAVDMQITQLFPKIAKLEKYEFPYQAVDYDSDDDTYHFIQKRFIIEDIETNNSSKPVGVVEMRTGVGEKVKKRNSSLKNLKNNVSNKQTTKRNMKPTLDIESDEEEQKEKTNDYEYDEHDFYNRRD